MIGFEIEPLEKHFTNRQDANDPRLGDSIVFDKNQATHILAGYPDDEGIFLNKGRVGAHQGPDAIRKQLFKMTPHLTKDQSPRIFDLGNLILNFDLAQRHENAADQALKVLLAKKKWIGLGGGHDYGYPDGISFLRACQELYPNKKPIIINFDAHLDVRPSEQGLSSGTPFYRLLNQDIEFDFFELGIQNHCNSKSHFEWVRSKGAHILTMEDVFLSGSSFYKQSLKLLSEALLKPRPCFLSIDIDGFHSSEAMGCSQSWPSGFSFREFLPLYQVLLQRLDVLSLGVYEVSPPLDSDHRTSKLAAKLIHQFLSTDLGGENA